MSVFWVGLDHQQSQMNWVLLELLYCNKTIYMHRHRLNAAPYMYIRIQLSSIKLNITNKLREEGKAQATLIYSLILHGKSLGLNFKRCFYMSNFVLNRLLWKRIQLFIIVLLIKTYTGLLSRRYVVLRLYQNVLLEVGVLQKHFIWKWFPRCRIDCKHCTADYRCYSFIS